MPFTAKVYEHSINDPLLKYAEANDLIPATQSGFRAFHSCETAVAKIYSDFLEAKDMGKSTLVVSIDLSAAFDTVDHDLLIKDLHKMGIRDNALSLIQTYLEDRTTQVQIHSSKSEPKPVPFGLPQGSVLSPLLFTLYTRSLALLIDEMGFEQHTYADDTLIYISFLPDEIDYIKEMLQHLFIRLKQWMHFRKLKINVDKTKVMLISPQLTKNRILDSFQNIIFDDITLHPVNEIKILGVIFDSDLTFKPQINAVIRKCNFSIHKIKQVRAFLSRKTLILLVLNKIHSTIDYCNTVYFQLPKSRLILLQRILKQAVRLIYKLPPNDHTMHHAQELLHWLTIGPRITYKIIITFYKSKLVNAPAYITNFLQPGCESTRTRYFEPRIPGNHQFATRAIKFAGPRLLNKLPQQLISEKSFQKFKKDLKTLLFENAYNYPYSSILEIPDWNIPN